MAALFKRLFKRKKQPPLVCAVMLDDSGNVVGEDPNHVHTDACFTPFEPLAVAELFQSQSCASCPPALSGIHAGTADANVVLLSYNVTLFDHTGWKDTFSSVSWDQRQKDYARRWQRNTLATPQLVVNGVVDGNGPDKESIQGLIAKAREIGGAQPFSLYMDGNDAEVRIDTTLQQSHPHNVLLVVYEANDQTVKVGKGTNKGKKMNHRNVVRRVTKIGEWTGGNLTIPLPEPRSALSSDSGAVAMLQEGTGGPIIAATKL